MRKTRVSETLAAMQRTPPAAPPPAQPTELLPVRDLESVNTGSETFTYAGRNYGPGNVIIKDEKARAWIQRRVAELKLKRSRLSSQEEMPPVEEGSPPGVEVVSSGEGSDESGEAPDATGGDHLDNAAEGGEGTT